MRQVISAALVAATVLPIKAQLFSRESLGGAVVGGIAGGLIAGGRHAGEGIAIGAGAGLVLGALASSARREYDGPYRAEYYESRPNYAVSGVVLGGIAGGVIGHSTGRHNTGAGIAIGAGTGLLLGSAADYEAHKRAVLVPYYYASPATVVVSQPAVTPETLPVSTPNSQAPGAMAGANSPMAGANSLFGR